MHLSTSQAATALGVADQTIRDNADAGRLTVTRVGYRRVYQIDPQDLRRFAAEYNFTVDEAYLATVTPAKTYYQK